MKLDGTYPLAATPAQLFAGMHDPKVLQACLPKCESVDRLSDGSLQARLVIKASALSATLTPKIIFVDETPPHSMKVRVKGSVLLARFEADIDVELLDKGSGTELTYSTEAAVPKLIALRFGDTIDRKLEKIAGKIFRDLAAASKAAYPTVA